MPCCRRALVLLLLFNVISNFGIDALKCRLYHRIWEDGHLLKINPDVCHTSNTYCVRATYSDPDERKKNGYSMGCDKVDCQGIGDPTFTGWVHKSSGEYCRKSRDYDDTHLSLLNFRQNRTKHGSFDLLSLNDKRSSARQKDLSSCHESLSDDNSEGTGNRQPISKKDGRRHECRGHVIYKKYGVIKCR
ncbi:hypothetical protein CAEBREN_20351 [Caenorhabditis brenneri]|uniref:Secreted protein n=1 Tax=Caenorhabditis brenneri TaxID=135651 RepID=G0M759_CAEBE|nr:hypothetical protein CAEBREN_20351 [Caenorhabditis brenneri]